LVLLPGVTGNILAISPGFNLVLVPSRLEVGVEKASGVVATAAAAPVQG
jgi:hypothetical protein